jgi:hypothetical protein
LSLGRCGGSSQTTRLNGAWGGLELEISVLGGVFDRKMGCFCLGMVENWLKMDGLGLGIDFFEHGRFFFFFF